MIDAPDGPPPPFDVITPDAMLPSGLVVWFPMDDAASANATDVVSGFGGTCAMGSCPQTGTGHHGGAFLFDGINDCIEIANQGQFGQAEITIAIWIEPFLSSAGSAVAKPVGLSATSNTWQIALLTGIRRNDTATMRWEHVNMTDEPVETRMWNASREAWEQIELPPRTLLRPSPKGGPKRAFTVPLSSEMVKILKVRQVENAAVFKDDNGWVFPTYALEDDAKRKHPCYLCRDLGLPAHVKGAVTHIAEPKGHSKHLVAPHRLRDTYTSALAEIKDPPLSPYVIDVLTNHKPPGGSVTAGYIGLSDEHLAECQERVTRFLLGKMKPVPNKRNLKSVA